MSIQITRFIKDFLRFSDVFSLHRRRRRVRVEIRLFPLRLSPTAHHLLAALRSLERWEASHPYTPCPSPLFLMTPNLLIVQRSAEAQHSPAQLLEPSSSLSHTVRIEGKLRPHSWVSRMKPLRRPFSALAPSHVHVCFLHTGGSQIPAGGTNA